MGGNLMIGDVRSEKIDLKTFKRAKFISKVNGLINALDVLHEARFGESLWPSKDNIFNGSSSFVMDASLPDSDVIGIKSQIGDVDIAVPSDKAENLFEILESIRGVELLSGETLVGFNRNSVASLGTQINCIFEFNENRPYLVQIDFELLPFDEAGPTEWARFSHSSSFDDARNGVKGVHHKYMLRSIVGALSKIPDAVIATPKSTYDNIKITAASRRGEIPRMLKFSVDHGLRNAYEPLLDASGNPTSLDGKQVLKEIPVSQSNYVTSIPEMTKMMGFDDDSKLWTFDGVVELCGSLSPEQQQEITNRYFSLLWGCNPRAQELERGNPDLDLEIKSRGWNRFKALTGVQDPVGFDQILNEYYKDYK